MNINTSFFRKLVFIILAILCLTSYAQAPVALLLGFLMSFTMGHPYHKLNSKATKFLLQISVVGLGFGMNVYEAAEVGKDGLIFTIASIGLTLLGGLLLGKLLSVDKNTSVLISTGTAICGGSAIAAMSPVINAKDNEISISLATVFILNSVALFVFPIVGELLGLTQHQFGMWAAIAIHDTSSVVGAAHKYGDVALKIATTVKLERALWIIPISLGAAFIFKSDKRKVSIPYFIFLFVVAMIFNTFVPSHMPIFKTINAGVVVVAKRCLTLTLFLIGAGLTKESLKSVGFRPMFQGVVLWIFISVFSLVVISLTIA